MVKKRDAAALTKADLIDGLAGVESKLGAKIEGLDGRIGMLEGRVDGNTKDIRRLFLESVKTNERITALGDDLRGEMRDLKSSVTNQLESFTAKMETLWRESIVYPKILDEHGVALRNYERRLQALEAWRQMP